MTLLTHESDVRWLIIAVVAFLLLATIVGQLLRLTVRSEDGRPAIAHANERIASWWWMVSAITISLAAGTVGSVILFFLLSFQALREFMSLTPTKATDHSALLLAFFVAAPLQYYLVWSQWYGFFAIMIPVFAFLLLPARAAMTGDTTNFLARAATTQWGLMACVYCLSYVPAILWIDIKGGQSVTAGLLLFLVIVVQASDVFQYLWGKTLGRHQLAPRVSPNKTWEGLIFGVATSIGLGSALWWATPFSPLAAAGMAAVVVTMGFLGGMVMSAIKRDRGVKDYGTVIRGHGGVLDRAASLLFAAPVFFHLVRYIY